MARPKRAEQSDLPETIKATAWKQIAESGASSLSLRAIARELSITAPAIYNHYASRDELVTALIVDAFREFGDSQRACGVGLPETDYVGRLRASGYAYRQWAIDHPQHYLLIFGTPIPGYVAPFEQTQSWAASAMTVLVGVLETARQMGALRVERDIALSSNLLRQLENWRAEVPTVGDVSVLYTALVIWGRVHGLVMFEISHQYPVFIKDPGDLYVREIEIIIRHYFGPKPGESVSGT